MNKKFQLIFAIVTVVFCLLIAACSQPASTSPDPEEGNQETTEQGFADSGEDSSDHPVDGETEEEEGGRDVVIHEFVPEIRKTKVVIDPGHGGEDSGAEGASGSYEKDFTLNVSLMIAEFLKEEETVAVYLTREEDVFLSSVTRDRPNFANDIGADLFVSIHANTFPDPTVTGTETFYFDEESIKFAETLHRHVVQATEFRDRGVRKEDLFVLRDTHMPAALIETGYISNPMDEQKMLTEEFQQAVARAIADGILEYIEQIAQDEESGNTEDSGNSEDQEG